MVKEVVILSFIFLVFVALKVKVTKNNRLSGSLLILYAGSFLTSILLLIFFEKQKIFWVPTFYLMLILILWILPFNISNAQISEIASENKRVKPFASILILFLFPATLYYAYYTYLTFTTVNLAIFRYDLGENSLVPPDVLNTIMAHLAPLYVIALVLFFIALRDNWSKSYRILLLISSFSFVFSTLVAAGRDGVIFWVLNFIVLFLIFKQNLNEKIKKTIIWFSIIFSVLLILVFLIITVERFSIINGGNIYGITYSLLDYYGQQTKNFCEIFYLNREETISLFPGVRSLFEENFRNNQTNAVLNSLNNQKFSDVPAYSFGFFAKNLLWGYGYLGSILISIIFMLIINRLNRKLKKYNNLFVFLIIILLYQIPMNGVFYYRQGIGNMDLSYILGIAICLLLNYKYKISKAV